MTLLKANSSTAMTQGIQIVGAMGHGIFYNAPQYAILAPLRVEDNAQALALMAYFRIFGQSVIFYVFSPRCLSAPLNEIFVGRSA